MSVDKWIDRCCVGTGNSTPLASQVALDSFVASTTATSAIDVAGVQVSTEPFYLWARRTWRFSEGAATGNLSEVGLGWTNTNLWNRALMRDVNGNPTTITVLSDEYLDIVSEIRVYPQRSVSSSFNLLDKNGEIISAHSYVGYSVLRNPRFIANKIIIASNIGASDSSAVHKGGITSNATLTEVVYDNYYGDVIMRTIYNPIYTATSCEQKFNLDPVYNNYAHKSFFIPIIGMLGQNDSWGYKFQITPSITKNNEQRMTYTFKVNWGRYVA